MEKGSWHCNVPTVHQLLVSPLWDWLLGHYPHCHFRFFCLRSFWSQSDSAVVVLSVISLNKFSKCLEVCKAFLLLVTQNTGVKVMFVNNFGRLGVWWLDTCACPRNGNGAWGWDMILWWISHSKPLPTSLSLLCVLDYCFPFCNLRMPLFSPRALNQQFSRWGS